MTSKQDTASSPKKKDQSAETSADKAAKDKNDSLLGCLAAVTRHYGRARSPRALVAGMPYSEDGMGPQLFIECAKRHGYRCEAVARSFSKIENAVLPCVLLLRGNRACLLLAKSEKNGQAKIFDPEKNEERTVSYDSLIKAYSGHSIYIRPELSDLAVRDPEMMAHSFKGHWFWSLMYENKGLYFQVMIAAVLVNIFALASPIFIMTVYDRVIPNAAMETGWVLGLGALAVMVFDFIMRTLRGYFIDIAGRKIDVIAARRLYDQVMDIKLANKPGSSGAFASMLKEFEAVRDFFTSATLTGFVDLPFSLLFIFVIYLLAGPVAFILLGLMGAAIIIGLLLQIPLRLMIRKSLKTAEAKHGVLVETLTGLETIKAIGADGRMRKKYAEYVGESASVGQKSRFISSLGVNLSTFMQQSASILIILYGMYMVRDGNMTVGALIGCVMLGGRAIAPMAQIAGLLTRFHQSRSSLKTLNNFMKMPVERPRHTNFIHRPILSGKITFDRVDFAYPGTEREVLKQVSFSIKPGEKVGLIGKIGSGKSTIARLLMGLHDPAKGHILLDDTDMQQIDPADVRRNIGYIAQDVTLFTGTIRENLIVSNPQASEEDILRAAQIAGAHEFIARHPMGYDAPIGERGEGLSGGQRQALALARAILSDPNIYVCDEPTNAMDVQSEEAFVDHIGRQVKDKTLILITHRQMLLKLVERLILIDNGKVIADGPRDEVIAALMNSSANVQAKQKGGA